MLDNLLLRFRCQVTEQVGQVALAEGMGVTPEHRPGETRAPYESVESLKRVLVDLRATAAGIRAVLAHKESLTETPAGAAPPAAQG